MAKDLQIIFLLDFYGDILSPKQKDFLTLYYDEDLSLSEIAENEGITRQGVRDAIKRAEAQLIETEEKLGLVKRFDDFKKSVDEISECAEKISRENLKCGLSKEISELTVKIRNIASQITE